MPMCRTNSQDDDCNNDDMPMCERAYAISSVKERACPPC